MPESEEAKRWEKLFSPREKIIQFHEAPYLSAVVPLFAGAIRYLEKEPTRILVVGGGRGHFSERVLPAVRRMLQANGRNPDIGVLETDMTDEIKKAPAPSQVVNVLELSRHFPLGSFDVVVGESMIHQMHPNIFKALLQIRHVMTSDGIFIHVQDTVPDYWQWLSPETRKRFGIHETKAVYHIEDFQRLPELSNEAHGNLCRALLEGAQDAEMYMTGVTVKHQSVLDARNLGPHPTMDLGDRNYVTYKMGNVFGGRAQGLPPGKKIVEYEGLATIYSKKPVQGLFEHMQRHPFRH